MIYQLSCHPVVCTHTAHGEWYPLLGHSPAKGQRPEQLPEIRLLLSPLKGTPGKTHLHGPRASSLKVLGSQPDEKPPLQSLEPGTGELLAAGSHPDGSLGEERGTGCGAG